MNAEEKAILLHDVRAAMVNHSALHKEVKESLKSVTHLIHSLAPESDAVQGADFANQRKLMNEQVDEILTEDLGPCMPMLKMSSNKLSVLLSKMLRDGNPAGAVSDVSAVQ